METTKKKKTRKISFQSCKTKLKIYTNSGSGFEQPNPVDNYLPNTKYQIPNLFSVFCYFHEPFNFIKNTS